MCYESLLRDALGKEVVSYVVLEAKCFASAEGLTFPVLFSGARANRPFRAFESQTRQNCSLCSAALAKCTSMAIVEGMEWLAASWPIKAHHGICYPTEHRASILPVDISKIGAFVEATGDAVACINMRGSGASVPEHFHAQLHDCNLTANGGTRLDISAFPLLESTPEPVVALGELKLYRLPTYPAFALILQGPWELLGRWLTVYLSASNVRPHNFALAPGRRLVVIPRGLEKAPHQENRYGASEMLGLVSPVTLEGYCAIQNADVIVESLRLCGLNDLREQTAVKEHAIWVMEYLCREATRC